MPAQMTGCPNGGAACSTVGFTYNPEHERVKETQADGSVVITLSPRYDTGLHFEKKTFNVKDPQTGALIPAVEYEHYLYAGGMMFGKYITTTPAGLPVTAQNGTVLIPVIQTEYYTKDHLGSIVAITDQTGAVTQRLSFDVFGKRRYPNGAADPNGLLNNPDMYHGYTGHEMLDAVGLIHMNGRIFDPAIGRFLSADPNIQAPDMLASYNRYSYCWNNPYACTDPSGYFSFENAAMIVMVAAIAYMAPVMAGEMYAAMTTAAHAAAVAAGTTLTSAGVTGMFIASNAIAGTIAGAVSSMAMGGGGRDILNGALLGGFGAALFSTASFAGGYGEAGANTLERYAAHSAAGCVSAVAGGGKCGPGAASALVGKFMSNHIDKEWNGLVQFAAVTIAGGVTSYLGGGKFENGAKTAAMGYLFNAATSKWGNASRIGRSDPSKSVRPEMEHSGETNPPPQLSQETKDAIKLGAKIVGYAGEGVAAHALAEGEVRVAAVALTVSTAASVVEGLASEEPGKTGITIAASMAAERVARIFGMSRIGAMTTGMFVGRHADYELNGPP